MPKSAGMHVSVLEKHQNGKTYTSVLLRQSYRDHNNRVQKRTLANLSHLPSHTIPLLRGALAGKHYAEVGDILGDPVRAPVHPYRYRRFASPLAGTNARLAEKRGLVTPSFRGTFTPYLLPVRLAHQSGDV